MHRPTQKLKWLAIAGLFAAAFALAQQATDEHGRHKNTPPVTERSTPLKKALELLRDGKTDEARTELNLQLKANPNDAETWHQIARSHLLDFYQGADPAKRRISLALAMEALSNTLAKNPNHIPAMRAKAVIHARAELLYYDPNLAYQLAAKIAKLEPNATGYLLGLTEWLSGEVRFNQESEHRVPHDPLLGLDRSIELLESLLDNTMPFSAEETAAYFAMGRTLSRRGNFAESIRYFTQVLKRTQDPAQRAETLRETATSYYRMGDYASAARNFYEVMQWRPTDIDRYLLKVAVDQIEGPKPQLPQNVLFPEAKITFDPAIAANLAFKDIAPELGINRLDGNGTPAWGDYDGDGKPDLFLSGAGTFMAVYHNDGGKFTDVTEKVGLGKVPSGYSLNLVDYDNDGKLDLYICYNGWNGPMKNRLYHNVNGHFVDVSKASGADDPGDGFVSLWGDLDNDGYPDLVIANGVLKDGSTPQIYRNNRNGTFTNMTLAAGIKEPPQFGAIGIALGDYDKDGDLDIFINGLGDAPNRLYRNDGNWHFTEVTQKAGVTQSAHNGFVAFFFDYNNDGWPDLMTVSLAPWPAVVEGLKAGYAPRSAREIHPDSTRLFRNNRNGTFTDVTFESKLYFPMGTMGAGVADLDNDGFLDIYFGTGDPQLTRLEPNRFFRNNGDGTFTDWTRHVGFARPGNKGHGVAFVDIDNNGTLDVYAQLGGHYPGDMAFNAFYKNLNAGRNNWLEIDLEGTKSNRFAIGAQITAKAAGLTVYREIKGSEGFGATSPYRVHIGLGQHKQIDELEIRWPSGAVEKRANIQINQILKIREKP